MAGSLYKKWEGRDSIVKPIVHKLPQDIDVLELHAISDWHIGDLNCDFRRIQAELERIKNTQNAYVILAGDLCNNAIKSSVSDTYSETVKPMEQLRRVVELLEPIKTKILCATPGNHEERSYKQDGIDLTRLICRELGIENNYRPDFCIVYVSFGKKSRRSAEGRRQTYVVSVCHGSRGGRRIGGKANALEDMSGVCDADVFFVGHTHSPLVFKDHFFRQSMSNHAVEEVERLYVNTAAALEYGGYGARQQYKPASRSNPVVYLSGTERRMWAEL